MNLFKLVLSILCLLAAFFFPALNFYQKSTTHQEQEATVVQSTPQQTSGRRGRTHTSYTLHYTYEVAGARYQGSDPNYQPSVPAPPGSPIRILYDRARPAESRIVESSGQDWTYTLVFLGLSAYFFTGYYRSRRQRAGGLLRS